MTTPTLAPTAPHTLLATRENGLMGLLKAMECVHGDTRKAYLLVQLPLGRLGILETLRSLGIHNARFELMPEGISWFDAQQRFYSKSAKANANGWGWPQSVSHDKLAMLDFEELRHSRIEDLWTRWCSDVVFGEEIVNLTPGAQLHDLDEGWRIIAEDAAMAAYRAVLNLGFHNELHVSGQTQWLKDYLLDGENHFGALRPRNDAIEAFAMLLGLVCDNAVDGLPEVVAYLNKFKNEDMARGFSMKFGRLPQELLHPYQERVDAFFRNCHTSKDRERFLGHPLRTFEGPRPVRYPLTHMMGLFYGFCRDDLTELCHSVAA